jgi:tetratricopeptide (TPR) repeat protein
MERRRKFAGILFVSGLIALGGWMGWRSYTTPVPPELPLDGMEQPVADAIRAGIEDVQSRPRSAEAWGKLAMVLTANGHKREGAVCAGQAQSLYSLDARWPYLRAHVLVTSGKPRQAYPFYLQALECASDDSQRAAIYFQLALLVIEEGQLDEGHAHVQALENVQPNAPAARYLHALLALARDDFQTARTHLGSLVASRFAGKWANGQLAAIALGDGDATLARSYQRRAGALPNDIAWPNAFDEEIGRHSLGRKQRLAFAERLEAQGRVHEAVGLLHEIVATSPDVPSYLYLATLLGKLQEYDEAEQVLRKALAEDASYHKVHHLLGSLLFYKGEKLFRRPETTNAASELFRRAVEAEDTALASNGEDAMAHLIRGRALGYLGRRQDAILALRAAVVLRPELSNGHLYLGELLGDAGEIPDALLHLENAVRLANPGDTAARDALDKWQRKSKGSPELQK